MRKLNLGCSDRFVSGFLNVDRAAMKPPSGFEFERHDLALDWVWEDSSVDYILAFDIFEHLPNIIHTMNETHRVLKPNGIVEIVVPTTDGRGAWQDPTHVSYWNRNTFFYFEDGNAHLTRFRDAYGVTCAFRVVQLVEQRLADSVTKLAVNLQAVK